MRGPCWAITCGLPAVPLSLVPCCPVMSAGLQVLRSSDLVASHQARDAAGWISDIKFSPDGQVRVRHLFTTREKTPSFSPDCCP